MRGIKKKFSTRLKQMRTTRGWTQQVLADRVGLSEEYICMLEMGVRTPSFTTLEDLAKAFGIKMSKFMEEFDGT